MKGGYITPTGGHMSLQISSQSMGSKAVSLSAVAEPSEPLVLLDTEEIEEEVEELELEEESESLPTSVSSSSITVLAHSGSVHARFNGGTVAGGGGGRGS